MKRGLRRLRDRLGLMVDWVVAQILSLIHI